MAASIKLAISNRGRDASEAAREAGIQVGGGTEAVVGVWTHGPLYEWAALCMYACVNGRLDVWIGSRMDGWKHERVFEWTDGFMDRCMGGRFDVWTVVGMD